MEQKELFTEIIKTKFCNGCKIRKPITEFSIRKSGKIEYQCKACERQRHQRRRDALKHKQSEVIIDSDVYMSSQGNPVTDSLKVAKVFGKEHKNVMQSIRNMMAENSATAKFFYTESYNSESGKQPMFIMNETGFTLLAMGFTGSKAMEFKIRYIGLFQAMRETIKKNNLGKEVILPQTFADALRQLATEVEEKEKLQKHNVALLESNAKKDREIKELQQQTDYTRMVLASKHLMDTTQIAQDYGMSAISLNRVLEDLGVQYKCNSQWILKQPYKSKGYVHSMTFKIPNTDQVALYTKWTQEGRLFIYNLLKEHNVLPLIERNYERRRKENILPSNI